MRKMMFLCLALLFAACADTEDALDVAASPTAPAETSPGVDATGAPGADASPGAEAPEVEIPSGDPPDELVIEDIEKGTGAEAKKGATVTVNYVGVAWSTKEEFDSSWERGQPATFSLGQVIEGWQEGIPGMKEGGRRRLVIPPDLAYDDQPPPGSGIKPGETLVFVIDLINAG